MYSVKEIRLHVIYEYVTLVTMASVILFINSRSTEAGDKAARLFRRISANCNSLERRFSNLRRNARLPLICRNGVSHFAGFKNSYASMHISCRFDARICVIRRTRRPATKKKLLFRAQRKLLALDELRASRRFIRSLVAYFARF